MRSGDYTSVGLAADCRRTTPSGFLPLLALPYGWLFALDAASVGVQRHWFNQSVKHGNWSHDVSTMDGWSTSPAMREWRSANPNKKYPPEGAGWWRVSFFSTELFEEPSARSLPAGAEVAIALSAACGELSAWVNGLPVNATAWRADPAVPMLIRVDRRLWNLKRGRINTVALRFAADSSHNCSSDVHGAGLRGRVYVVGKYV